MHILLKPGSNARLGMLSNPYWAQVQASSPTSDSNLSSTNAQVQPRTPFGMVDATPPDWDPLDTMSSIFLKVLRSDEGHGNSFYLLPVRFFSSSYQGRALRKHTLQFLNASLAGACAPRHTSQCLVDFHNQTLHLISMGSYSKIPSSKMSHLGSSYDYEHPLPLCS